MGHTRRIRSYHQLENGVFNSERVWKRKHKKNKHHIINRCKKGKTIPSNIIVLDVERHNAWHFLFHNLSFREVIELLERTIKYQNNKTL